MKTTTHPGDIPKTSGYGFATFFKEDSLYYFQLNDEDGRPLFFSHGYQSARSRDNGIQVVIRNAAEEDNYERQQSKKGTYFFILKSGNNQEIGRSVTFSTQPEVEESINTMKRITKDTPIFDKEEETVEKEEKNQVEASVESPEALSPKELPIEKMPRYKFSIIYYPDSGLWNIKHDQSGNARQLKACDGKLIEEFLKAHLPAEKANAGPESQTANVKPAAQEGIPRKKEAAVEEEIEVIIRGSSGMESHHLARAGYLGQLEVIPQKGKALGQQTYDAKVLAQPIEGKESIVVADVKNQPPYYDRFLIPIYEANKLQPGTYRLTVNIHQGKEGKEEHDYKGSRVVILN